MAIFLKVLNGPDAGKTIEMQEGVTIGRSPNANFSFQDPRMSGRHVQVVRAGAELLLIDLGSKNGFRVDGIRSTKTAFISGSSLKVGGTEFEVVTDPLKFIDMAEAPPQPPKTIERTRVVSPVKLSPLSKRAPDVNKAVVAPKFPDEIEMEAIVAKQPKPVAAPPKWHEYFVQFIKNSLVKIKSKPRQLRPFRRLVKLNVMSGIQSESVWTLGYGPRQVGPRSCDLVIEDPGAPGICFSLAPDDDSVVFTTDHPDVVKLNERSVRTDTLKPGDVISFASTSIQFGFEHE